MKVFTQPLTSHEAADIAARIAKSDGMRALAHQWVLSKLGFDYVPAADLDAEMDRLIEHSIEKQEGDPCSCLECLRAAKASDPLRYE